MTASPRRLPLWLALTLAFLSIVPARSGAQDGTLAVRDGEQFLTLPCMNRSTISIVNVAPGAQVDIDVYNDRGKVKRRHRNIDFGVDGVADVDLSLPEGFIGSCVVTSDTPIATSVVRTNPGGSKTPIGLPPGPKGGSNYLGSLPFNEARTVTSSALLWNPTPTPRAVDNFCNDADNNSISVTHWDHAPYANTLMDPSQSGPLPFLDLDAGCQQVFTPGGAPDDPQASSAYRVTDYANTGDRLVTPGGLLTALLGRTQIAPFVYASEDGTATTSLKIYNIGPGTAKVRLTAYKPSGKRAGKKRTVKVPESKSVVIDDANDFFSAEEIIIVTGTSAKPRTVVESIVSIDTIAAPQGRSSGEPQFGTALPTYTADMAFADRAAIPALSFATGDEARIGVVNAGRKKTRARVQVIDSTGTTHLNRVVTIKKHGSALIDLPPALAGLALHVLMDVLRGGPALAYAEEKRADGEINLYAAQRYSDALD
ncbi:MAG: hypothetical protein GKS06_09845 [Acidobacteria bacterium]|nr:hypothetical protein [Acidobacteriota bacterium]